MYQVFRRGAAAMMLLVVFIAVAVAEEAPALKGMALVIGQSKYARLTPLPNPGRDAELVAATLGRLGFNVTMVKDRDARQLHRDLRNFAEDAAGADVALVYYSGHGIEAGGDNWLVPVEADGSALANAEQSLVAVSEVMDGLRASVPLTLLFLDACRNSPFPPGATLVRDGRSQPVTAGGLGFTRGVAPADASGSAQGLGTVIGFAAEPGMVALDGPAGGTSYYAAAMARHLVASAGLEFGTLMRLVTQEVYLKTQGRQRPWVNETLTRLLYFGGTTEDQTTDDGRLDAGRRALLLSIDALPAATRRSVEEMALQSGLRLDPLYGMLKELQVDTSAGPEEIDRQLRAGVEAVKKLKAERDVVASSDAEIARLTNLADRAEAEGALPLALDYRARASARAEVVAGAARAAIDTARERLREAAATYAQEAETAALAFDHKRAAEKFRLAFTTLDGEDAKLARRYKWQEADALQALGDVTGDTAALEAAAATYGAALQFYSRAEDAADWAGLHNNLGNTLAILGDRRGDDDALEQAVQSYRAALLVFDRDKSHSDWAMAQNNLGNALRTIGSGDADSVRLREAIAAFRAALGAWTRDKAPYDWAMAQNNLGNALTDIGARDGDTTALGEAVAAYRAALAVRTPDLVPFDWAETQGNLGNALTELGQRQSGTSQLEQAVVAYRQSLLVYTRDKIPYRWATTQSNLATALEELGSRESGPERLEEAAEAYSAALTEITRDRVPLPWATIQNNLGVLRVSLGERKKDAGELEDAVAALRAALGIWTRDEFPLYWAMAQNNLGNALVALGTMSTGTAQLEQAEAAYRAALQVRTHDHAPLQWAQTLYNLGNALLERGNRETGTASLEEAVMVYRASLTERTHDRVPLQWAASQDNMGQALAALGKRTGNAGMAREGKAAMAAAWDEYRRAGISRYDDHFRDKIAEIDATLKALGAP